MGYALLWIECLVAALLLEAALLACLGRLRRPWVRRVLAALVLLVPTIVVGALTGGVSGTRFGAQARQEWSSSPRALTVALGIASAWLGWSRRSRPGGDGSVPAAVEWSRGKLAWALVVAVGLLLMTFWNLDMAARQQLATVRAEASAMALSAAPGGVPDHDNAALVYAQVFDGPELETGWPQSWQDLVNRLGRGRAGDEFKGPELLRLLGRHEPEILLLRRAAAMPACDFGHDYGRPRYDMLLPELNDLRRGGRLLAVDARARAVRGDARGALEDANALFGLARHAGGEPLLISALVAMSLDGMATQTLEAVFQTVPVAGKDLDALADDGIVSFLRLYNRSVRWEEAAGLWFFSELGESSGEPLQGLPPDQAPSDLGAYYRVFGLADDLRSYRQLMRQQFPLTVPLLQQAARPSRKWDDKAEVERYGVLTALLIPELAAARGAAARREVTHRLARIAIALHRHRAQHGRFPERLDELAPGSIPLVPCDPYDGQPMRLKRTERGWEIYSVGPDLADDQGRAIDWERETQTGDITFEFIEPR